MTHRCHTYAKLLLIGLCGALAGCGARSALVTEAACEIEGQTRPCESICGEGTQSCDGHFWTPCNAPLPGPEVVLAATIRDFLDSHPDFEGVIGEDPGIVQTQLGADSKPIYAGNPLTPTTNGQAAFDQWYRDTPGVNLAQAHEVTLLQQAGELRYSVTIPSFFPIDGQLLGNQGRDHNYHFTLELHTRFRYVGGEVFRFRGDDDVWVFVNNQLVIDLGGVHSAMSAQVDLDAMAEQLSIERGDIYPLDFFFAERHTSQSSFSIDTTITELDACP